MALDIHEVGRPVRAVEMHQQHDIGEVGITLSGINPPTGVTADASVTEIADI